MTFSAFKNSHRKLIAKHFSMPTFILSSRKKHCTIHRVHNGKMKLARMEIIQSYCNCQLIKNCVLCLKKRRGKFNWKTSNNKRRKNWTLIKKHNCKFLFKIRKVDKFLQVYGILLSLTVSLLAKLLQLVKWIKTFFNIIFHSSSKKVQCITHKMLKMNMIIARLIIL